MVATPYIESDRKLEAHMRAQLFKWYYCTLRRVNMNKEKDVVKKYYETFGWQKTIKGIYNDSYLYSRARARPTQSPKSEALIIGGTVFG